MSLAIGRLTGSVISAAMFIKASPLPYRFGFDRAKARELLAFGLPLAGSSLLVFAIGYSDQLVAGSVLGTTALGFYVLAFNISSWPISILSQPVRTVAPATFARLQHDPDKMVLTLRTTLGSLARLTLPACLSIAGAAVPIVLLLYGSAWAQAATVLPWLALNAIFRIVFELFYDFMVVLRRSVFIMTVQAVWLAALIPALIIGAHHFGLPGLALAQVIVSVGVVLPMYLAGNRRVGLRVMDVLSRTWLPILAGVVAGGICFAISARVTNSLLACLLSGGVAALTIAALLAGDRHSLRNLRNLSA
jgi:PST family polysaccharide transporter